MENSNLHEVTIPKGATYKGQEVLKVISPVVGETAKDTGYKLLLGNGDMVFVTQAQFAKLDSDESEGDEK